MANKPKLVKKMFEVRWPIPDPESGKTIKDVIHDVLRTVLTQYGDKSYCFNIFVGNRELENLGVLIAGKYINLNYMDGMPNYLKRGQMEITFIIFTPPAN